MQIIEADFKVEYNNDYFLLSFKKDKKELKDEPKIPYKSPTYYSKIDNAIIAVCNWRKHKKYPFKEITDDLYKALKNFKQLDSRLKDHFNKMDIMISNLEAIYCKDISKPIKKVKKARVKGQSPLKKVKYNYTDKDFMIEDPIIN